MYNGYIPNKMTKKHQSCVDIMFVKQYNYAVTIIHYFLKPIGIWPISKDASWIIRIFRLFIILLTYSLILFMILLSVLHILVEDPNVDRKMKLFGPISFAVVSITKYTSLMQKISKLCECLDHVKIDWQNSCLFERKVMEKYARINRFLSVASAIFMYTGGLFYHALTPMMGAHEFSMIIDVFSTSNGTAASRYSIATVQKLWPNLKVDLVCKGMYLVQCWSGYVLDTVTVCTCSLAAVFIGHVCAQLEVTLMQLRSYVEGQIKSQDAPLPVRAKNLEVRLSEIILRHTRTLKFAANVEEYLSGVLLIEFIGSTVNICLLGFYLVAEWGEQELIGVVTYFILLIAFTFNIFIFCYIGELLVYQCEQVGSIYHIIDWYNLPPNRITDLIFIMRISQCPTKLTAGKFVDLTLSTFTDVMKTAFAYFNIMRTVVLKLRN